MYMDDGVSLGVMYHVWGSVFAVALCLTVHLSYVLLGIMHAASYELLCV